MRNEYTEFKSFRPNMPQVTARLTLMAAEIAASEGNQEEAELLLTLAHGRFAEQFSSNPVPNLWLRSAADR